MKTVSLRNHSIDIIRYFCAILVVTIHTAPFRQSCYGAYYVLTQFIARIGVLFLYAVIWFLKFSNGNRSISPVRIANGHWQVQLHCGSVSFWCCILWSGMVICQSALVCIRWLWHWFSLHCSIRCRRIKTFLKSAEFWLDLHTMHILWLFYIWKRQARRFTGLHMVCPCFL